jgi:MazG family protein
MRVSANREEAAQAFGAFVDVIKALRTPGTGCPWDLEQDHRTLRPFLVEEAYEVLEALDRGDDAAFREELGDLLLQVVLHAQVAADRGAFTIVDVVHSIADKMVRRHPHVFGPDTVSGSAEVLRNWEQIKAAEAEAKGHDASQAAALERLPASLPALQHAQRLGEKAAQAGFEWTSVDEVLDKLREEMAELEAEIGSTAPERQGRLEQELGDVLHVLCSLARRLGVNAEQSLRDCNRRFVARFRRMEQAAVKPLHDMSADELRSAWRRAADTGSPKR